MQWISRKWRSLAMALGFAAGCAGCTMGGLRLAPAEYPDVARGSVSDDFFGTRVEDPYRWLEDLSAPSTQQFIVAQNAVSQPYLAKLPQYDHFRERIAQLYRYERFGVTLQQGGRWFYLRNSGQEDQSALYVSEDAGSPGRPGGAADYGSANRADDEEST